MFCEVLVASSSIPGVFHLLIRASDDIVSFNETHVDGLTSRLAELTVSRNSCRAYSVRAISKTCRGVIFRKRLDVDDFLTTRLLWTVTVTTKSKEGYEHDGG